MRRFLILFIFIFIPVHAMAQDLTENKLSINSRIISSQEFKGFEKCKISNKLSTTLDELITHGKPVKKEEYSWMWPTWKYAIKSEVMGLPAKAIILGVCDDGSQACGWGSFLAVVIAKPLKEAKSHLKKRTGIDFTKEKRDKLSDTTLRPVLAEGQDSNESVLYCDPGVL